MTPVYAGIVSYEGKDYDAFINEDRQVCIKTNDKSFKTIGHISEYMDKVRDLFGYVGLWKIWTENYANQKSTKSKKTGLKLS